MGAGAAKSFEARGDAYLARKDVVDCLGEGFSFDDSLWETVAKTDGKAKASDVAQVISRKQGAEAAAPKEAAPSIEAAPAKDAHVAENAPGPAPAPLPEVAALPQAAAPKQPPKADAAKRSSRDSAPPRSSRERRPSDTSSRDRRPSDASQRRGSNTAETAASAAEGKGLSGQGGNRGSLIGSMKTPAGLNGAGLILYKLAQLIGLRGDAGSSGFGTRYHPATVSYQRMYKALDLDLSQVLDAAEFRLAIRRLCAITQAEIADAELNVIFESIDVNRDGSLTLQEFCAFARGMQSSSFELGSAAALNNGNGVGSLRDAGPSDQLLYAFRSSASDAIGLKEVPHLSAPAGGSARTPPPRNMDRVHLILWYITQRLGEACMAAVRPGDINLFNPSQVNYYKCFKLLDLDANNVVTRDEWAIVLRRKIGVAASVTDADLDAVFDCMDSDGSNAVSLKEFAAFCRGASVSAHQRGSAALLQPDAPENGALKDVLLEMAPAAAPGMAPATAAAAAPDGADRRSPRAAPAVAAPAVAN